MNKRSGMLVAVGLVALLLSGCGKNTEDVVDSIVSEEIESSVVEETPVPAQITKTFENANFIVAVTGNGVQVSPASDSYFNYRIDLDLNGDNDFEYIDVKVESSAVHSYADYSTRDLKEMFQVLNSTGELCVQGYYPKMSGILVQAENGVWYLQDYMLLDSETGNEIGKTLADVETYYNLLPTTGGMGTFVFKCIETDNGEVFTTGQHPIDSSTPYWGVFEDTLGREVNMYINNIPEDVFDSLSEGNTYDIQYFRFADMDNVGFYVASIYPTF